MKRLAPLTLAFLLLAAAPAVAHTNGPRLGHPAESTTAHSTQRDADCSSGWKVATAFWNDRTFFQFDQAAKVKWTVNTSGGYSETMRRSQPFTTGRWVFGVAVSRLNDATFQRVEVSGQLLQYMGAAFGCVPDGPECPPGTVSWFYTDEEPSYAMMLGSCGVPDF